MVIEKEYVRWLCLQPCLVPGCKWGACGHHLRGKGLGGGMGLKPNDLTRIPLCLFHHQQLHQQGILTFEKQHGLDLVLELVRCLQGFLHSVEIKANDGYWGNRER